MLTENVTRNLKTYDQVMDECEYLDSLIPVTSRMEEGKFTFEQTEDGIHLLFSEGEEAETKEYFLDYEGTIKVCALVGISEGYARKFPQDDVGILLPQVNYWFDRKRKPFTALVDPKDNRIKAFASGAGEIPHQGELITQVYDQVRERAGEVWFDKTFTSLNKGFHVGLVFGNISEDMGKGDYILGGIHLRGSKLSNIKMRVTSYMYRLECLNGMISAHERGCFTRMSREDVHTPLNEWLDEKTALCLDNLQGEFERIRALKGHKVDDHAKQFARQLLKQYPVPKETTNRLLGEVEASGDLYDAMNIFTAEANNPEYAGDPARWEQLQIMGGRVASHREICPHCHSEIF